MRWYVDRPATLAQAGRGGGAADRRRGVACCLAAALAAALVGRVAVAEDKPFPIKGLRIPLKLFENGQVKMRFSAEQARAEPGEEVLATGALVEIFDESGAVVTRMEAERCRFDREAGRVRSEDAVRLTKPDLTITGVGMVWTTAEEKITLLSNVRVVLQGSQGLGRVIPDRRRVARPQPSGRQRGASE
jgi:lipopolysaccharide assembly outer membrane protein LptD (OstA)